MATANTFPRLLAENVTTRGDKPAYREKDLGIWNTWTWKEAAAEIRAIACGLAARGFRRGDKLAIVGDNRPELYWSMVAAQCLGGIPVPLYQDSVADEMRYVLDHAEARFAVVEDQEQVDKLLEIKDDCPALEVIIYKDPRGLGHYDLPHVVDLAEVIAAGRTRDTPSPGSTIPRWRRVPAPTPRSSFIPPAPPAGPRAWCCRTTIS